MNEDGDESANHLPPERSPIAALGLLTMVLVLAGAVFLFVLWVEQVRREAIPGIAISARWGM